MATYQWLQKLPWKIFKISRMPGNLSSRSDDGPAGGDTGITKSRLIRP
jgi:hypothetical protein